MKRNILELQSSSTTLLEGVISQLYNTFNRQVDIYKQDGSSTYDSIKSEEIVAAVGFVTKYVHTNNPAILKLERALMSYLEAKNDYHTLTGEGMRAVISMAKLHEAQLQRFIDVDNTTEELVFKEYQQEAGW